MPMPKKMEVYLTHTEALEFAAQLLKSSLDEGGRPTDVEVIVRDGRIVGVKKAPGWTYGR